jgi:hypothetical protein
MRDDYDPKGLQKFNERFIGNKMDKNSESTLKRLWATLYCKDRCPLGQEKGSGA